MQYTHLKVSTMAISQTIKNLKVLVYEIEYAITEEQSTTSTEEYSTMRTICNAFIKECGTFITRCN